ncbi:MAG TPA: mechanosensitive ion channel family protein, partial [Polyangiales bacterium]
MGSSTWRPVLPTYSTQARAQHSGRCGRAVILLSYSVLFALCLSRTAHAQPKAQPDSTSAGSATDEVQPEDSPRSTLEQFFKLTHAGKYADAAKYLELPPTEEARGAQLAARLTAVLDRYAWNERNTASAAPGGDPDDGLPSGVDEVGKIPGRDTPEPVRLVHRGPADARWLFSRVTVQRIDGWYEALPHRWLIELAPEPLLRMGPLNLLWAQWSALPLFLLVIWSFGAGLSRLSRKLLERWAERTPTRWDDALLRRLGGPITLTWRLLIADAMLPLLGLYSPALTFATRSIRALLFATFFWALARSVDVAGQMFADSRWTHGAPGTRALLLFGSRFGKFVVASFAIVALFSELGYPVTSLIAGLGVGGIAVALAAQKSLENLIGAFAIAIDQPFREGDFVKIDGCMGTVEIIGMRSTRFRTADRTIISIPNGKLADMRVETYASRDRCRLGFTFGVGFDTTEAQMRAILKDSEKLLRDHPKIWKDGISVRFTGIGESSLTIEVGAWYDTRDFDEFTVLRQDFLLKLMALVEKAGAKIALPGRSLEIADRKPEPKEARLPS